MADITFDTIHHPDGLQKILMDHEERLKALEGEKKPAAKDNELEQLKARVNDLEDKDATAAKALTKGKKKAKEK